MLKKIVGGAASQFGREFGRAGANKVLKDSNHYTIKDKSNSNKQIKDVDTDQNLNKIKFIVSEKGNILRLIKILDLLKKEIDSNTSINNKIDTIKICNVKISIGESLINDKSQDTFKLYLKNKEELISEINTYVKNIKTEANKKLINTKWKKRKKTIKLSLTFIGLDRLYLGKYWLFIFILLIQIASINYLPLLIGVTLFNLKNVIIYTNLSDKRFNDKYNTSLNYYKSIVNLDEEIFKLH